MAGSLGMIANVGSKVLPHLPAIGGAIGGIARGIGSIFGGKHQQRAEQVAGGIERFGQVAPRMGQQFGDMYNTGRNMFNVGRDTFQGARDAFRQGDFGGGMGRIGAGFGQMGGYGDQMRQQFSNFMQTGQSMGGFTGGMGNMAQGGGYGSLMRPAVMSPNDMLRKRRSYFG